MAVTRKNIVSLLIGFLLLCLLLSDPIVVLSHFKSNTIHKYTYLVSFLTCIVALPILWLTHCRSAWIAVLAIISYSIYSRCV